MYKVVSIVTPTYNQGDFIAKTIESILMQAGDFLVDYVIIDGGSTDQTVNIIKQFEDKLKSGSDIYKQDGLDFYASEGSPNRGISYRWVSEKDRGQSDGINKGFRMTVGEFETWLNSDDYYPSTDVISTVLSEFKEGSVDVVVGNTIAYDGEGREIWRQYPLLPSLYTMLYIQQTPQQPAIFYTKKLLDQVGGVDESLHYVMDVDLWLRFLTVGAKFSKIEKYLAVQVYHDRAKSTQGEYMLEKFAPEDRKIKSYYRSKLGWKKYYYSARIALHYFKQRVYTFGGLILPRRLKDIVNKFIGWKRSL